MKCIDCKSLCWKYNWWNERKSTPICSHLASIYPYNKDKSVLSISEIRVENISKCPKK